jgi:hypothetical protein
MIFGQINFNFDKIYAVIISLLSQLADNELVVVFHYPLHLKLGE